MQPSMYPDDYWTILALTPPAQSTANVAPRQPMIHRRMEVENMQVTMLDFVRDAFLFALDGWLGLYRHTESLLSSGEELVQPGLHDKLLFDDEVFSGSRKYFWLIDSLHTFTTAISSSLDTWKSFESQDIQPHVKSLSWSATEKEMLLDSLEQVQRIVQELEHMKMLFANQRAKTLALRDGVLIPLTCQLSHFANANDIQLFSASSVQESKAATRLGENVRLLTYVSIFYLPLNFCSVRVHNGKPRRGTLILLQSLWSTTSTFSYSALGITMAVVAIFTYLSVWNMNFLVERVRQHYITRKQILIEMMLEDRSDRYWENIGKQFKRYESRSTPILTEPSEWQIFYYGLARAFPRYLADRFTADSEAAEDVGSVDPEAVSRFLDSM